MKTKEIIPNKTIEILHHDVSYFYDNDQKMPEAEEEHVENMIKDGYSSGELIDGEGNTGWWKIPNWKDIALELYNALKDARAGDKNYPLQDKAIARFDKNWG